MFHRDEGRVRAHFFLCMLAYYVEWHMRQALAPLLFEDESVAAERATRDPVAKPKPSADGLVVHSFDTLLADLATQAQVTYRVGAGDATFEALTPPTPLHQRAFDVLGL